MYKKILICCVILLLFLAHGTAGASVAPLERKGNHVNPVEEKAVSLISYRSNVQWYQSQPTVSITMILKNKDSKKKAELITGIPKLPYKSMEISKPLVYVNGENATVSTRKAKATEGDTEEPYLTWYTWPITIKPGETIAVKCFYTIFPTIFEDRSKVFKLPLELLEFWEGPVGEAVVTVDVPSPYAFHPAPNPLPTRIMAEGRLEWRYADQENFPAVIISTKDSEDIAIQYLKKQKSEELKEIGDLYGKGLLTSLVKKAEAYIDNHKETDKSINEVKYVLAQAYALMNEKQKTLDLYKEIGSDPGFGNNSAFFKEKIAFDQYHLLQQLEGEKAAEDFLLSIESSSPVLQVWKEAKAPVEESETPPPEPTKKPSNIEEKPPEKKLIKNVTIWGITVPVEILFLLSLILIGIVVIYAILGLTNYIFNRKRRFRYYHRRKKWF